MKSLEQRNYNKQKMIEKTLQKVLNEKSQLEQVFKLSSLVTGKSSSKNKKASNFKLPSLVGAAIKKTQLDDSYISTAEEKVETDYDKKPSNFFGYEQKVSEDQKYHSKRINDILKLELNTLRKPENKNNKTDYSEIFYQFKKQTYVKIYYNCIIN